LRELAAFIQLPPTVQSPGMPEWPHKVKGRVMFNDVTFTYPDACNDAIAGFALQVEPYTTTAFVGPSGCGKTTLMSLLMREYDPSSGEILVDGVDLRAYDYGRYRREMVAMVSQTIDLFDRSIADNIRLGKPGASDEEVLEAARLAGAHEFIMRTTDGYATQVGENGIRLSGGQKQRLAIARALIRRPAILIMDEATSSLDAKVQEEVQANLNALMASRTCTIFVIAHRLSTVMSADRVVVIEAGTVSAIGTHEELQKMNGLYKELCDLELKRGILD
jgi:ABC-type multidrug transport system fused ATPase/permease subunit